MQIQKVNFQQVSAASKILFKKFEKKHTENSIQSIVTTELQENSFSSNLKITQNGMKNFYQRLYKSSSVFKNSVIALDTEKQENVVGSLIGIDLVEMFDYINNHYNTEDRAIQRYLNILNITMDPLFSTYRGGAKKMGKTLLGENLIIQPEYQNMRIGKYLFEYFLQQALSNDYENVVYFYYNPIVKNLLNKYNSRQNTITFHELQRMEPEISRMIHCDLHVGIIPLKSLLAQNSMKSL